MVLKAKKVNSYRLLLVTFDLTQAVPGDIRYRNVDAALSLHGPIFRPIKQLRLLITQSSSRQIKASVLQRTGAATTILVAPLRSIPAWSIEVVPGFRTGS